MRRFTIYRNLEPITKGSLMIVQNDGSEKSVVIGRRVCWVSLETFITMVMNIHKWGHVSP